MTDYREVDIVKRAIETCRQFVEREFLFQVEFEVGRDQPPLESPAEAVFAVAFLAAQFSRQQFSLERQVDVEANDQRYRFDFVVNLQFGRNRRLPLAIEIDGHAFHEKTLEQVTRRNKRDRDVQTAGYRVMHFSYSELVRDPMKCADEAIDVAMDLHAKAAEAEWRQSLGE